MIGTDPGDTDQRVTWAFWAAAGLVAIGAVAPTALTAGGHSRLASVIIPFGLAAIAFGANAFMYRQGRSVAVGLYFVAGLAIVYGILAMVAVPLRLAVLGTCPPAPAHCPIGFEQPLTSGENSGLGVATFCGVLAIFVGFYGLLMLYRRRPGGTGTQPALWPSQPSAKPAEPPAAASTPAMAEASAAATVPTGAEVPAAVEAPAPAVAAPEADDKPRVVRPPRRRAPRPRASAATKATEEPKELPAPDEPAELPAPEEPKELPPPA